MTTMVRETKPVTDAEFKAAVAGELADKTNGTPLSALLSAGIGVFALGIFTTLAEASASFANQLKLVGPVGPLSGKTTFAVVAWVAAWAVSFFVMRGKNYTARPFYIATFALVAGGFLLTFPIFFDLFAPK